MRMSADQADPGYKNLRPRARITVDGVEQRYCITADEELGYAVCFVIGTDGQPILTEDKTELVTERRSGVVIITITCDNCGADGFRTTDGLCDGCNEALKTDNVPHDGPTSASCDGPLDAVVGPMDTRKEET